jgi:hypothetical protein
MTPFVPDHAQKLAVIRDLLYEYGNLMAAAHFDLDGAPPHGEQTVMTLLYLVAGRLAIFCRPT